MANIQSLESGRKTSVVGFKVTPTGQLFAIPARFYARKREVVLWIIGNTSGGTIEVTLEDFAVKGESVAPFDWIINPSVTIQPNQIGFIAGVLKHDYPKKALFGADRVNYSIRVRDASNAFDVVHDPDGDIKP